MRPRSIHPDRKVAAAARDRRRLLVPAVIMAGACVLSAACGRGGADAPRGAGRPVLTGQEALGDWTTDAPGVRRRITPADMPPPYQTPSVDNGPKMVPRPDGALPQ